MNMSRLVVSLLLLAIAAGIVLLGIRPQWAGVAATRAEIRGLEALHRELTELAANRDTLTAKYNTIPEADLAKLRALAPAVIETASVLVDIEAIAQRNILTLDQIEFLTPDKVPAASLQPPAAARRYGAIPLTMNLRGTYENFREFLIALEHNLRLVDVNEIAFTGGANREASITVKAAIYHLR